MTRLSDVVARLDAVLDISGAPDYPSALNGLQFANGGLVSRVAASVDFSARVVRECAALGADLLLVHHGMFWGGQQPIVGARYETIRELVAQNVAVYSAHLPLDRHDSLGNNVLLARELGLEPVHGFGRFQTIEVGVQGATDLPTQTLIDLSATFAAKYGGAVRVTGISEGRRTRRWAIITGAGASSDTLREARAAGIDTLVVGEGPHHTAVEADDAGIAVIYAGHYATETLGVQALARWVEEQFGLPWSFVAAPTSL